MHFASYKKSSFIFFCLISKKKRFFSLEDLCNRTYTPQIWNLTLIWNSNDVVVLDQLKVGDIVDFFGVENPSTGYKWIMTPDESTDMYHVSLNQYRNDYYEKKGSRKDGQPLMTGVPGQREVKLEITNEGSS